jgi:tetratricopeptide (TPR) repeat protein
MCLALNFDSLRLREHVLFARSLTAAMLLVSVTLGCGKEEGATEAAGKSEQSSAEPLDAALAAEFNRAVGMMGRFEFEQAAAEFARIAKLPNAPREVALGHAIAILNQSREGAQDEALALLGEFLKTNPPKDLALRARYCQGLCLLYLGKPAEALTAFLPVAEARGEDAYAQYFTGQALEQTGEYAKAIGWYERAATRDARLKSAFLGIQRCARRAGDEARAESALKSFEDLAANPRAKNAEFKYTRMGSLGLAPLPKSFTPSDWKPPSGPIFEAPKELAIRWPEGYAPQWSQDLEQHAVVGDLDADGRLDILIARALVEKGAFDLSAVFLAGQADGSFVAKPDHALATLAGGSTWSILLGDVDNDGLTDLYLCRSGGNRLILAEPGGGFRDATETWQAAGTTTSCGDGALADLDHDGDLDVLLLARDGPIELLANVGGSFKDIAKESLNIPGFETAERGPISTIIGDFDYDRDADIFILNELPPHTLLLNERLWRWVPGTAPGFTQEQLEEQALAAAVVDLADIPLRRLALASGGYLRMPTRIETYARDARTELAVVDATGDGHSDLLLMRAKSMLLLDESGRLVTEIPYGEEIIRAQAVQLDATKGPSVLALRAGKAPLLLAPGPGRGNSVAFRFSGRDDPSQSMRSNTSGIGTSYAVRVGNEWFGGETFRSHTGRGQSLAPVSVGIGPFETADVVEIEWSDGVFQSEVGVKAGEITSIVETQRQISSCPVLFAWNGERMEFVSDLLGVGGLGYLLEPGVYSEPRPRETFVFPEGALVPRADGSLRIALAEPMEESCMLDQVALRAIDLPEGWDLAPDERLAIGGVAPTGDIVAWRNEWIASTANASSREALAKVDLVAPDVGPHDPRFLGRLAGEQVLELEFATDINAIADPWLVIDGWVEYPYCQTMFAAWQAGAKYRAPSLEARGADGTWTTLVEEWGYPAGMPRRMALPIPHEKLPAGVNALRMRTNMEVYFDSVRLVAREALPTAPIELALAGAELASVGFAQRTTGPQKQPHYDDARRLPLWDCRFQFGLYTEFGDVAELVRGGDESLAVFGPGEQVTVDFRVPAKLSASVSGGVSGGFPAEAPAGTTRRYVLEVRGWCKDMDLFTKDGETIEPLPGSKPAAMEKMRTRPMGGR